MGLPVFYRQKRPGYKGNKWASEQAVRLRLLEEAERDFDAIVSMLIRKYNPRRIYQWGSMIEKDKFCEISDIDIGVEGCGGTEQFFAMYGDAMNMTRFPLDMVEMEKIEPEFAEIIKLKGRLIYERE